MKQDYERLEAGGALSQPTQRYLEGLRPPEIVRQVENPALEAIRRLWWRALDRVNPQNEVSWMPKVLQVLPWAGLLLVGASGLGIKIRYAIVERQRRRAERPTMEIVIEDQNLAATINSATTKILKQELDYAINPTAPVLFPIILMHSFASSFAMLVTRMESSNVFRQISHTLQIFRNA
jgi:hypothetical protein